MFGYLAYQQQLIDEIYANYIPPLTAADFCLQYIGNSKDFGRVKKRGAKTGEFAYQENKAYIAIEKADYIKRPAASDYLILIKTIWIPPEQRSKGLFSQLLEDLIGVIYDKSRCSILAVSRPFDFMPDFNPLRDNILLASRLDYSADPAKARIINRGFERENFAKIDPVKLTEWQGWDKVPTLENSESCWWAFWSDRTTWMLDDFFNVVLE